METIDSKAKIGNFFQNKVLKYEPLILILIVLLVGLVQLSIKPGIILTLTLTSIAIIYFFTAFAFKTESEFKPLDIFLHKILSLGSAIAIIGILFKIQKWPNDAMMLTVGAVTLGICFVVLIYQTVKQPETEKFNKITFLRIIILTIICAGLLFIGTK
jgi:hypothetical protein